MERFCSSLSQLTDLKIVHLSYSLPPATDFLRLSRTLFSLPLQILNLDGLSLTGTISKVLRTGPVNLDQLERLYLESCDLDDNDFLALGDSIFGNIFPVLCMISLLGNDFSKMLASIEHFLERCEEHSSELSIVMDSRFLPEGLQQEEIQLREGRESTTSTFPRSISKLNQTLNLSWLFYKIFHEPFC